MDSFCSPSRALGVIKDDGLTNFKLEMTIVHVDNDVFTEKFGRALILISQQVVITFHEKQKSSFLAPHIITC